MNYYCVRKFCDRNCKQKKVNCDNPLENCDI